jgi:hypothetical protein
MDLRNLENFSVFFEVKSILEQLIEKYNRYYQEERDSYERLTHRLNIFEQKYFGNLENDHVEDYENPSIVAPPQNAAKDVHGTDQDAGTEEKSIDFHCNFSMSENFPENGKVFQQKIRKNVKLRSIFTKCGSRISMTDDSTLEWKFVLSIKLIQKIVNRYSPYVRPGKKQKDQKVWSRKKWSSYLLLNSLVGRSIYYKDLCLSLIADVGWDNSPMISFENFCGIGWLWLWHHEFLILIFNFFKLGPSLPRYNGQLID